MLLLFQLLCTNLVTLDARLGFPPPDIRRTQSASSFALSLCKCASGVGCRCMGRAGTSHTNSLILQGFFRGQEPGFSDLVPFPRA
jgi:hypothetical protein